MPHATDEPTIRLATPEDAAATAAYMHKLRAEVKDGKLDTIPWRPVPSDEQQREYLQKMEASAHSCIVIALEGTTVAGMLTINGSDLPFDCHAATLGISVAPHWKCPRWRRGNRRAGRCR